LQTNNSFKQLVLDIKNLSFSYERDTILEDISLELLPHDFLVVIGPNGGGKSTLMKLILGMLHAKHGTIKIFGMPQKSGIQKTGYVPQNTNINTDFPIKVIDVVMMGAARDKKFFFRRSNEDMQKALDKLRLVGMEQYAQTKIGKLSGGQRQRVIIARALFSEPKLLILDEPTSSIDVEGQKQIYSLLKELSKTITIVVVSHDMSIILEYATKVAHINKKLTFHDISHLSTNLLPDSNHVCAVELLELLGKVK
jgi:zinc transport system ATP-binding protein